MKKKLTITLLFLVLSLVLVSAAEITQSDLQKITQVCDRTDPNVCWHWEMRSCTSDSSCSAGWECKSLSCDTFTSGCSKIWNHVIDSRFASTWTCNAQNSCQPDLSTVGDKTVQNNNCPGGKDCKFCQVKSRCSNDNQCPQGKKCNSISGHCYIPAGQKCEDNQDCRWSDCYDGKCRAWDKQCTGNADCVAGSECVQDPFLKGKFCKPTDMCITNNDCGKGLSCQSGKCKPSGVCAKDNDCDVFQLTGQTLRTHYCVAGHCQKTVDSGICDSDYQCERYSDETDKGYYDAQGKYVSQKKDYVCVKERCVAPKVTNTCEKNSHCKGILGVDGKTPTICLENKCKKPSSGACTSHSDCSFGDYSYCLKGQCFHRSHPDVTKAVEDEIIKTKQRYGSVEKGESCSLNSHCEGGLKCCSGACVLSNDKTAQKCVGKASVEFKDICTLDTFGCWLFNFDFKEGDAGARRFLRNKAKLVEWEFNKRVFSNGQLQNDIGLWKGISASNGAGVFDGKSHIFITPGDNKKNYLEGMDTLSAYVRFKVDDKVTHAPLLGTSKPKQGSAFSLSVYKTHDDKRFVTYQINKDLGSGSVPLVNGWNTVVLTYDGSQAKAVVNGKDDWKKAVSGKLITDGFLTLGGGTTPQTGKLGSFTGQIDGIKLFNRVLSDSEVKKMSPMVSDVLISDQVKEESNLLFNESVEEGGFFTNFFGICSDSDGGKDLTKRGIAKGRNGQERDNCAPGHQKPIGNGTGPYVWEAWCEKGKVMLDTIACPSGTYCYDGACVKQYSCTDPDGLDIETASTAKGFSTLEGVEKGYSDVCADGYRGKAVQKGDHVWEATCTPNGELEIDTIACGNGSVCMNGACVSTSQKKKSACYDSDRLDIFTRGEIGLSPSGNNQVDRCAPAYRKPVTNDKGPFVWEGWCTKEGTIMYDTFACPNGYTCDTGKCIRKSEPLGFFNRLFSGIQNMFKGKSGTTIFEEKIKVIGDVQILEPENIQKVEGEAPELNLTNVTITPLCEVHCDGNTMVQCADGKEVKTDCGNKKCTSKDGDSWCQDTCSPRCEGNLSVTCVNGKEVKSACNHGCQVVAGVSSCKAEVKGDTCIASCDGKVAENCVNGTKVKVYCDGKCNVKDNEAYCVVEEKKACAASCDGNTAVTCSDGKEVREECDTGYVCSDATCVPEEVEVPDCPVYCDGNVFGDCNGAITDCSELDMICKEVDGGAGCVACEPQCVGNTLVQCDGSELDCGEATCTTGGGDAWCAS